jgi:SulP family sulfate permease
LTHGVTPPRAKYRETIARAVADIKGRTAAALPPTHDAAAD